MNLPSGAHSDPSRLDGIFIVYFILKKSLGPLRPKLITYIHTYTSEGQIYRELDYTKLFEFCTRVMDGIDIKGRKMFGRTETRRAVVKILKRL